MPKVQLAFGKGSFAGLEETSLPGNLAASAFDAYQNEVGAWFKRPGLLQFSDTGSTSGAQGIFWASSLNKWIVVLGGVVKSISYDGGTVTTCAGATLPIDKPVTFVEGSAKVYIAGGGTIVSTDGSTSVSLGSANPPPAHVSYVTMLDRSLICNDVGSGRFWWTNTGTEDWDYNWASINDAQTDQIVALGNGWRELLLLGRKSTEIWYNTGETPATFRRLDGAFIERGCSAPYTLCKADNTWWWMDQERNFIRLEGRNAKVVSQPIASVLRAFTDVTDFVASPVQVADRRFIILTSPFNRYTLVYDYALDAWYRWGQWVAAINDWDDFPIQSFAFDPVHNVYAGLGTDGKVYTLSGDATNARFYVRSGHVDHGTHSWKFSSKLVLRFKRGFTSTAGTEPMLQVRWRDQNGPWGNWHQVSMGATGDYKSEVTLHRLGRYRTRQYEIAQHTACPFCLISAEETIEAGDD